MFRVFIYSIQRENKIENSSFRIVFDQCQAFFFLSLSLPRANCSLVTSGRKKLSHRGVSAITVKGEMKNVEGEEGRGEEEPVVHNTVHCC